jgi:hypothetical protein
MSRAYHTCRSGSRTFHKRKAVIDGAFDKYLSRKIVPGTCAFPNGACHHCISPIQVNNNVIIDKTRNKKTKSIIIYFGNQYDLIFLSFSYSSLNPKISLGIQSADPNKMKTQDKYFIIKK